VAESGTTFDVRVDGLHDGAGRLTDAALLVRDASTVARGATGSAATLGLVGADFGVAFAGAAARYADGLGALSDLFEHLGSSVQSAARSYDDGDTSLSDVLIGTGAPR
jgi:hypothetical protein